MTKNLKDIVRLLECKIYNIEDSSVIHSIWKDYPVCDFLDEDEMNKRLEIIHSYLNTLSQNRKRIVLAQIHGLCVEHERAAFMAGVCAGGRLIMEIVDHGNNIGAENGCVAENNK